MKFSEMTGKSGPAEGGRSEGVDKKKKTHKKKKKKTTNLSKKRK